MGNSNSYLDWNMEQNSYAAKVSPRGEIVSPINVFPYRKENVYEGNIQTVDNKKYIILSKG